MDLELERVDEIIEKNISEHETQEKSPLIPVLQDIQTIYGWLPEQALVRASRKLKVPSIELYGVASFYEQFRLKPLGDYHIVVCTGTACHVRGAPLLMSELERNLGIAEGEVTPDQKFSLEGARCVGTCAVAPVIIVNGEYHGNMDKKKLGQLIEELKEGGE